MRARWLGLAAVFPALAMQVLPVDAKPKIVEKTEYYSISGKTGWDLFVQMNRRGPRHGFLTKAIAQTQFEPDLAGDWSNRGGVCRVVGGQFRLTITYVYPQPQDALPGDLARRWKLFQDDNVRHEKQHGRIARKMAEEADRAIGRFAMRDRPNCRKANAALHKELGAIGKKYRLLQNQFDRAEHRDGGPVEKSIRLLIGR